MFRAFEIPLGEHNRLAEMKAQLLQPKWKLPVIVLATVHDRQAEAAPSTNRLQDERKGMGLSPEERFDFAHALDGVEIHHQIGNSELLRRIQE